MSKRKWSPLPGLTSCANGDGRPISPPSRVICRECMDAISAKLQAIIDRLDGAKP